MIKRLSAVIEKNNTTTHIYNEKRILSTDLLRKGVREGSRRNRMLWRVDENELHRQASIHFSRVHRSRQMRLCVGNYRFHFQDVSLMHAAVTRRRSVLSTETIEHVVFTVLWKEVRQENHCT